MIIAANIRRLKERKFPGRGGSKKCADALGVTPQQWSPWEIGTRGPDEKTLKAIARLFGVAVDDLLRELESAPTAVPVTVSAAPSVDAHSDVPPAAGQAAGSGELVEIMNLLLQAQNEFVSGSRSSDQLSGLMRDVLRYTRYVMDTTKGG
jgi:transcriptional regulator with XRE-family HTH domain